MLTMAIMLILGHLLADYALQGDFMSKAKNHKSQIPGVPWFTVLLSHSAIHGAAVAVIAGSPLLGAVEVISHAVIDYAKCDGRISFNQDQCFHLAMKASYLIAIGLGAL